MPNDDDSDGPVSEEIEVEVNSAKFPGVIAEPDKNVDVLSVQTKPKDNIVPDGKS